MLVDSHCHLNYLDDPDAKLAAARAAGVGTCLCISVEAASHPAVLALAERHRDVWASAGVHPESASNASLDWVRAATRHERVVGLGETGLDYLDVAESDPKRRVQRDSFAAHLEIARETDLPVVVHTRAAEADTRDLLHAHRGVVGVLHCFTESWELARAALDLGWYVSISGIVTFRNGENVRDVARRVPQDRLLVETDSPWLAPVPMRGKKNEPAFVVHTATFVAQLRGDDRETFEAYTSANFARLFHRVADASVRPRTNSSS
ncbi:MAG TPA: TatD family hydrolase [Pseudomonadales bacterium]|nr:TatD family hydrolase [Pseudomonadales bacterium]